MGVYREPLEPWQHELNRAATTRQRERRDADRRANGYPDRPARLGATGTLDEAGLARRAAAKVAMRATLDRLRDEYGTE
ncbi:hypothetical protein [Rhodococcoides kroppenstedtii]|uniref:hypothetical protein n=1 Tax=Rhodococcoides kroppenstedtii TaxID=293050 RepID=UPI0028EBC409|nr:hypothetical protein [Rhodococcus kroppenstedtii]